MREKFTLSKNLFGERKPTGHRQAKAAKEVLIAIARRTAAFFKENCLSMLYRLRERSSLPGKMSKIERFLAIFPLTLSNQLL